MDIKDNCSCSCHSVVKEDRCFACTCPSDSALVANLRRQLSEAEAELVKLRDTCGDLYDTTAMMEKQLKAAESRADSAEANEIWGFYENEAPIYTNRTGAHELSSIMTVEEANGLVSKLLEHKNRADSLAATVEVIREYEWETVCSDGKTIIEQCPICDTHPDDGHRADCWLGDALSTPPLTAHWRCMMRRC